MTTDWKNRNKIRCAISGAAIAAVVLAFACMPAQIARGTDRTSTSGFLHEENATAMNSSEQVEATADTMESDGVRLKARGNVRIRRGDEELTADYVDYEKATEDVNAVGNVTLKRGNSVWSGPRLRYNFRTKAGLAKEFTGTMGQFHIAATNTVKKGANSYLAYTATVTTCTNKFDHPHYCVTATKVAVVKDDSLTARNAVFHLGPVPVMYMPYWRKTLDGDSGFRFYAGASSDMGAFLLSSYRYRLSQMLKAETHLDYRTKRGVAGGQDFRWHDPEGLWNGELTGYYVNDREPMDEEDTGESIDNSRYRVLLKHSYSPTSRDSLLLKANYLSDTDILEDFFEDEYRESSQPDNYASYTHREDNYTVNAIARGRINDFYTTINRTPEVSVDFTRQQIADTVFYYEGQTAAAFLQKAYSESESNEQDYSCFRIDSSHMGYYPNKQFGFLNLIPRAGYRATYYSVTRETASSESITTSSVTNDDGSVTLTETTNTTDATVEKSGDLRSLFELGCEASFKVFKTWGGGGAPMRHVIEPYLNYTLVPEPDLLPESIYQFDEVDGLDKNHSVKVGVRNKLQTKREDMASDLIDADVYTTLDLDTEEGEDLFDFVYWDVEITPVKSLIVDLDGSYSAVNSTLETFNAKLGYSNPDLLAAALELRFKNEDSTLLSEDITFYLNRRWYLNVSGRYEFDEARLEEVGSYIQRNYDCLATRLGGGLLPGYTKSDGSEVRDEWRVTIEFWLTAFPNFTVSGRHRN